MLFEYVISEIFLCFLNKLLLILLYPAKAKKKKQMEVLELMSFFDTRYNTPHYCCIRHVNQYSVFEVMFAKLIHF